MRKPDSQFWYDLFDQFITADRLRKGVLAGNHYYIYFGKTSEKNGYYAFVSTNPYSHTRNGNEIEIVHIYRKQNLDKITYDYAVSIKNNWGGRIGWRRATCFPTILKYLYMIPNPAELILVEFPVIEIMRGLTNSRKCSIM